VTNIEIWEKAGMCDVQKMRTILLMNAKFNMNNKKLAGDMMTNAEKHKVIVHEQCGSWYQQCMLSTLSNKQLRMDIL
jgi:hypothetical protein